MRLIAILLLLVCSLAAVERAKIDTFRITAPTRTVTLTQTPAAATHLLVFRNGLLLSNPDDYTRTGLKITFQPGCEADAGDIIVVRYWVVVT